MDAEILFFMSEADQKTFFVEVEKHCDRIETRTDMFHLIIGDCYLQFTPTLFEESTLYCGRLEIRMGSTEKNCKNQEKAKSVFRKLRNWIKKHYWSRLAYLNKNKRDKLTPSRNHWLGPDAKRWKETNPTHNILKLSKTSWMQFDIGF